MPKVYAKQVNPEYQESPLMIFGEYPETIVLTGNRHYNSHTIPAYDAIMELFDSMAETWWNESFTFTYENGGFVKHPKKPGCSICDILREYGFEREDGKLWNNHQKHEWRLLMENGDTDDEKTICNALKLITGKKWESGCIRGTCQSDWQDVFYIVDEWDKNALDNFEAEYFNTGTEWIIHDEDGEPETAEDIIGYSCYCYSWNDDGIRAELAEIAGCKPEDVVMYQFDGCTTTEKYKEVV